MSQQPVAKAGDTSERPETKHYNIFLWNLSDKIWYELNHKRLNNNTALSLTKIYSSLTRFFAFNKRVRKNYVAVPDEFSSKLAILLRPSLE